MKKKDKPKIFSGEGSEEMWAEINKARTIRDLRRALYGVCCNLQVLEHRLAEHKHSKLGGLR